jgi:hypothetical protein
MSSEPDGYFAYIDTKDGIIAGLVIDLLGKQLWV